MDNSLFKFIGRYKADGDCLYFYNGGSGLSFKMKGKHFDIDIRFIDGEGYYYFILDKDYKNKVKISSKVNSIPFFDDGEHEIDIIKANEANDNTMVIRDIYIKGELLPYTNYPKKRACVYGDSTIAGFGILAHSGNASIHSSDSVEDFCFQALYELDFDMDIMSASGYGLVFSAYTYPMDIGIIDFYNKVKVHSDIAWEGSKNDLLIVSLGTNDNAFISENPENRQTLIDIFKVKYRQLIDSEVNKNPDIKILMVYGTLKEENAYPLIEETYQYLKPVYKNLYIHKFDGDNTAISNHAFVDAHKRMAEELKNVIKEIIQ
jgi:hypothetical protein